MKLDYTIQPDRRDNRYRIEAYFFVPRSLGIDSYTYTREQFYADVQAYILFKTPAVSLGALLEGDNARSPFNTLAQALGRAMRSSRDFAAHGTISHELRLLGCLVRANLRDRVVTIAAELKDLRGQAGERPTLIDDVRLATRHLLDELDAVIARFRSLRPAFSDPVMPVWLREVYQYVDEYLSLSVETSLTKVVEEIDHTKRLRMVFESERHHLTAVLLGERHHRQGAGYQTVLKPSGVQEHFIYRSGVLKKYVSSVLFLEISKEKEGRHVAEVVAAVAAGTAMLFATVASIVSQARWGTTSIPFIIAIVGCHFGLTTTGGTEGVGQSTTRTVVVVSIAILVADYFLTRIFVSILPG